MRRFGLFLMPAILLAMATAVHAQTPPAAAPPTQPDAGCPAANWYFQAFQDSAAALQKLRVMCAAGQAASCCDAKAAAGAVKGCEVGQAPKTCCCAKACACCETCKAKKDMAAAGCEWNPFAQTRVAPQSAPMMPCAPPIAIASQPWPMMPPAGPICLPPHCGTGVVQIVPVRGDVIEYRTMGTMDNGVTRVVQVMQPARVQPVHFATPDLDARCERIQQRGDVIVLEGNVLLLVKKHAQPVRIEAQRVIVNMRDGSFSVVSDDRPATTTSYRVIQSTGGEMPNMRYEIQLPTPTMPPATRAVPVPPMPSAAPSYGPPQSPPLRDYSVPR
jgi:hypothetical protein